MSFIGKRLSHDPWEVSSMRNIEYFAHREQSFLAQSAFGNNLEGFSTRTIRASTTGINPNPPRPRHKIDADNAALEKVRIAAVGPRQTASIPAKITDVAAPRWLPESQQPNNEHAFVYPVSEKSDHGAPELLAPYSNDANAEVPLPDVHRSDRIMGVPVASHRTLTSATAAAIRAQVASEGGLAAATLARRKAGKKKIAHGYVDNIVRLGDHESSAATEFVKIREEGRTGTLRKAPVDETWRGTVKTVDHSRGGEATGLPSAGWTVKKQIRYGNNRDFHRGPTPPVGETRNGRKGANPITGMTQQFFW